MATDTPSIAWHLARTRWGLRFRDRQRLQAWQDQQLARFFRTVLPRAPRYAGLRVRSLDDLPMMDKRLMMDEFLACNTRGVDRDTAMTIALQAETSRDFSPTLGDLTVGLSSGTSGNRGVFLVSAQERRRWAGILLARALTPALLQQLVTPWRPPLRVAFFLRANSNLYTTLASRRLRFCFFDLLEGVTAALPRLQALQPDVLVGPPALLRMLANAQSDHRLHIQPAHVISVADVLEPADQAQVQGVFGTAPAQLYQATEGFLGYTCEQGKLHLNETFVHVAPEWLDAARTRCQPIITDFTRSTQLIVRYRLNDVLRFAPEPCACGRAERTLAAIEGRSDEVLWLPARAGQAAVPIFPDQVRRAMLLAGPCIQEYRWAQDGMVLQGHLLPAGDADSAWRAAQSALATLWEQCGVIPPTLQLSPWTPPAEGAKRRRIQCLARPEGIRCGS